MPAWLDASDPPVFTQNLSNDVDPVANQGVFNHHPNHSLYLYNTGLEVNAPVIGDIPTHGIEPEMSLSAFMIDALTGP